MTIEEPVHEAGHDLAVKGGGAELEELGERIAELAAQISAATYELLAMLCEFDERGGWGGGFRSCAHWLCWRVGLDLGAAREKMRVARALGALPLLSAAMRRGEISYSKVRALTRIATPATEEELLRFGRAGTAAHVERLVRGMRRVDRIAGGEKRLHAARHLRAYTDEDGMVVVRGRLAPEAGAALLRALAAGVEALYESRSGQPSCAGQQAADDTSVEQRRADALGLVAESALTSGLDPGSRGDRYQVVVHVDAEVLVAGNGGSSWLADGSHVSAETSRRLACDSARVVMRHAADGRVLDVGRRTRAISPALRRALEHRDGGCRFPGCGRRLCDAHHVEPWAEGGATSLANTLLLCRRHHRAVHEEGFSVELAPAGDARFYRPDGRPLQEAPALLMPAREPVNALVARLASHGVDVDAGATLPDWWGGPVDYGWEIDWLRWRDHRDPASAAE
ncbi:MAG TPA: DUF222 domain-containing protein [Thermoanaerobaculia bacterium]|jgi:hypothetical protein|nr:DUF222 domain-containing protein [Thermoanaerobaculia bacterium]